MNTVCKLRSVSALHEHTLKNKGSIIGFSVTTFCFPKEPFSEQFLKEPLFSDLKNLLWNGKIPLMLKVLRGTIDAIKEHCIFKCVWYFKLKWLQLQKNPLLQNLHISCYNIFQCIYNMNVLLMVWLCESGMCEQSWALRSSPVQCWQMDSRSAWP